MGDPKESDERRDAALKRMLATPKKKDGEVRGTEKAAVTPKRKLLPGKRDDKQR